MGSSRTIGGGGGKSVNNEEKNSQGGNKLTRVLIWGLVIIVLLLVGAYGALHYYQKKSHAENLLPPGPMYQLEPFYVNLTEPRGKAILKVAVVMELTDPMLEKDLEKYYGPVLRDKIIGLLRSKEPTQLRESGEYEELKLEIKEQVNGILPQSGVTAIYFTEFIITQ